MMFKNYYGIPNDAKYGEDFMKRFPILFQNRGKPMSETCMCWGIECPLGWYHILEQLFTALEFMNMEFTREYGIAAVADQVKEKWGTLRVYYTVRAVDGNGVVRSTGADPDMSEEDENKYGIAADMLEMMVDQHIAEAEALTENTCADCGTPLTDENKVTTKGWITFICNECDEKRKVDEEPKPAAEQVDDRGDAR